MRIRDVAFIVVAVCAVCWAREWREMREEADKGLPPWIQYYNWLKGEPKLGPFCQHLSEPESLNVRLVGKWGRGPAARVTGRDTLVYLALGSEVAVFNCVNAHNPRIVNEIQCRYVVDRPILKDSILYCVLQGGVEVFNVANPASVTRIKYLPISAVDMCINDTMAYTIDADSFKAYRIVTPDSFQRLGACADSGYYIAADSGFAYLCDRWGLYVIDATDPTNPHQASMVTGAQTGAALIDSGYCYYTQLGSSTAFVVADVSNPYLPVELGRRPNTPGGDIYKLGFYAYLSGFQIMDVSGHSNPTQICSLAVGGIGAWTRSPYTYSFVAIAGLMTININDPVHPQVDTLVARADLSYDVSTSGALACVANYRAGMKVLGVGTPAVPMEVGCYDSVGDNPEAQAVASRDSLGYLMAGIWSPTGFRVMDLSDPRNPRLLASAGVFNPATAVILRDTLAYVGEESRFQVFSIANPRNPRLVGSCGLPNSSYGLCLRDTLAFVANLTSLQIIDIAKPESAHVVGVFAVRALGVAVRETVAFVGGTPNLFALSVANPSSPYLIDTFPLFPEGCWTVQLDGALAYIGTGGASNVSKLRVMDVSRPDSMRCIGYYVAPSGVRQVCLRDGFAYCACFDAGVCIFETTSTSAVAETSPVVPMAQAIELTPNPASSFVNVREEVSHGIGTRIRFYDAAGREVLDIPFVSVQGRHPRSQQVNISALPDGCYFVKVEPSKQDRVLKLVKFEGR
jgi:hypothetical protein